jgi:DNA polymerase III subunit gamma/tau
VLLPGADHSTEGVQARLDRLERRVAISGGDPGQPVRPAAAATPPRVEPPVSAPVVEPGRDHDPEPPPPMVEPGRDHDPEPPPPVSEPAPPVGEPVTPPAEPAISSSEPATTTAAGSPLSLVDVRRLWPDIVEATKQRRRVTWIHLTQQAQVVQVDDKTLTLGFGNAGARDSFDNGGSAEIVRQAAIDVVGHDWRVETIVDPGAQPAAAPPPPATESAPPTSASPDAEVEPDPGPAEPPTWVEPASASARQAISPIRTQEQVAAEAAPADADGGARHDDIDAETTGLDGAQLLQEALGAEVIEEIPHQ